MAVPPPILDERELKDIFQQLRALAALGFPNGVPEWTPPSGGDAGTMLQRAYARLLELALLRLNQVPEKNLLAFLDTMGVSLLPPSPARVPLTFGLTKGTPPTLIPQGAQAGSQATDERPAVIFETEDELTVIPAQITQSYSMDPTWDRYTEQTPVLAGQSAIGYTPFVGTKRMPHVIYFGDDALLNFSRRANVRLSFRFVAGGHADAEVSVLLAGLAYQYRSQGILKTLPPASPTVSGSQAEVAFSIPDPIEAETLQGAGPTGVLQTAPNRWLRAVLTTPFPDSLLARALPPARALRLLQSMLRVSAQGLLPDFAFTNTAPVDVTKDFFPFGEAPKVGDTFYIASREALAKPNAVVTLNVRVRPPAPHKLIWEYSSTSKEGGWVPFIPVSRKEANDPEFRNKFAKNPFSYIVDETAGFTHDGRISGFAVGMGNTLVNSVNAVWVRARLDEGGYSLGPQIRSFIIAVQGKNDLGAQTIDRRPPREGFASQTPITFLQDFLPFGLDPGHGDTFYFGENLTEQGGFPIEPLHTRSTVSIIEADVILNPDPPASLRPRVTLEWEYLSRSGWQGMPSSSADAPGVTDNTHAFTRSATVQLRMSRESGSSAAEGKVNDQSDFWVRVRINGGDYGRAAEFIPVDPDDPKQGFRLRPGTGNLQPPQVASLTIDYEAENAPAVVTQNGFLYRDETSAGERGFKPFVSVRELVPNIYADMEPTLYLGFDAAFPEKPVTLYADIAPRALAGAIVKETRSAPAPSSLLPPLQWEYFNGTAWRELMVFDATNNFTASGSVEFLTPEDIAPLQKFDLTAGFWVRARSSRNDPFDSQHLLGLFLNTVPALQAVTVQNEIIGSSNEQPDQQLNFARTPVLPGQQVYVCEPEPPSDTERARIEEEEGPDAISERTNPNTGLTEVWVRWHEIDTFLRSDAHSRHYTLDHVTGAMRFGDGVRGMIPSRATNSIAATYRTGGGTPGNVEKAGIAQVKSALAGVAGVSNQVAADGGAAVETIPMVEERGPQTLRHRSRAVSSGDFEWLARQALGTRVARSRGLSNVNRDLRFEPGWVTLMIVPGGQEAKLSPSSQLIREVEDYLDDRTFIGLVQQTPSRINVIGPGYVRASVVAKVVPQDIDEAEEVKQRVTHALAAFLHPLTGGTNVTGWEFGRDLYASEIAQALEGTSGVNHVETLRLVPNIAQHRLVFTSPPRPIRDFPAGSEIITGDRRKSALLAQTVLPGGAVERIKIKGFKESDRLTKALDLRVVAVNAGVTSRGVVINVTMLDGSPVQADAVGFPTGSLVTTYDGARRMRLASGIPRSHPSVSPRVPEILVEDSDVARNLATDDVLTVFYPFPMKVTATRLETITLAVQRVAGSSIAVAAFDSQIADTPRDSIVSALDDTRRARLAASIPANQRGLTIIDVQEEAFASRLRPGDALEVHTPVQTLSIEPYEVEVAFPVGSLISTLDNRVRLPLLAEVAAGQLVTAIKLHDFISSDTVSINRRDGTSSLSELAMDGVEPLADIVFLDDNFLIYSGTHRITMVGEARDGGV